MTTRKHVKVLAPFCIFNCNGITYFSAFVSENSKNKRSTFQEVPSTYCPTTLQSIPAQTHPPKSLLYPLPLFSGRQYNRN